MAGQAPFFIVGAGRSGTTLLRLILIGHSHLHIPPETWFLRDLVREFPLSGALTQPQAERAVETMVRHERWPDLGLDADRVRLGLAALPAGADMRELLDLAYQRLLQASGKVRLGDKTPHYFEIVPELATLYPDAAFIYLVRDGRDVAMSWIDAGWQRYYEAGFEWPRAMAALRRDRAAYPGRVLEVRYEDLARAPVDTTQAICDFLGEKFEPAMLDWHGRIEAVAARDRHLHGRLQQPLTADAVALWRRRLSPAECFAMEACLRRDLTAAGYELMFKARAWWPAFMATAGMLGLAAPLLRRAVPHLQKHNLLPRNMYF